MLENITVSEYKRLYDEVIALSFDMEDAGFNPEEHDEDILKCKYIIAIYETLSDVPLRKAEWFFQKHKVNFDLESELDDLIDV